MIENNCDVCTYCAVRVCENPASEFCGHPVNSENRCREWMHWNDTKRKTVDSGDRRIGK